MKKILAIDIGNTNISIGLGSKLMRKSWKIATSSFSIPNFRNFLKEKLKDSSPDTIIIASVVPALDSKLNSFLNRHYPKSKLYFVGKDIIVPIENRYHPPQAVGQDRLVNAYYVKKIFSYPAIAIDLGTALTFDLISDEGAYLGGLIFPGLRLSLEMLAEKTALLPKVNLKYIKNIYGKNTKESIVNGIIIGFSSLIDGVIKKLVKIFYKKPVIVATGGDYPYLAQYINCVDTWVKDMTLLGLFELVKNLPK